MRLKWAVFVALLLAILRSPAQTAPPPSSPGLSHFEVTSVKMLDAHSRSATRMANSGDYSSTTFPSNRFFAHNTDLLMLVSIAYDVDESYIEGAPNWSESQLYDVDATVEGGKQLSYDEMKPLLQDLLTERFHLSIHRATKPVSGFALVVAKGGPKLQAAAGTTAGTHAQILPNGLRASNAKLQLLAGVLSRPAGAPVIDQTGLTGVYDIHLSFAPRNDPNSPLPDLFTAIQEQLGLKLQPQKVPVEYLIVDHVDRTPTEN